MAPHKHKGSLVTTLSQVPLSVMGNERASIELDWIPETGDTVEFECQCHPEGTWDSIEGFLTGDIDGTGVTDATDAGIWVFDVRGISRLRVSASAIGTTPVLVKLYAE